MKNVKYKVTAITIIPLTEDLRDRGAAQRSEFTMDPCCLNSDRISDHEGAVAPPPLPKSLERASRKDGPVRFMSTPLRSVTLSLKASDSFPACDSRGLIFPRPANSPIMSILTQG